MSENTKISELEIAVAHQDRQIQDLSEMIHKQWKEIDALKRRLEMTNEKLQAFENASEKSGSMSISEIAAAEKPPHY